MTVTRDQVRRVASLARLELSADEEVTFTGRLGAILEAFETLAAVDVTGAGSGSGNDAGGAVIPTAHPFEAVDRSAQRDDVIQPSLPPAKSLANAPAKVGTSFAVPKILE